MDMLRAQLSVLLVEKMGFDNTIEEFHEALLKKYNTNYELKDILNELEELHIENIRRIDYFAVDPEGDLAVIFPEDY